ncbi:Uncharacterised protein [uncultured archaeon]|nr:Uncharacterised protein [uncultured archaeon]
METEIKQYIEFFYPKDLYSTNFEAICKKIDNSPQEIEVPRKAFAYRYFERQEAIADDKEVLVGNPRNYSETHYIGRILTLDELKKEMPYEKIQIRNLEKIIGKNNSKKIVFTRGRTFQLLDEKDIVIEDSGTIFCEPKLL